MFRYFYPPSFFSLSLSFCRWGAEAPLISNLFARRYQLEYLSLHFKSYPRASANGANEPGNEESGGNDGWRNGKEGEREKDWEGVKKRAHGATCRSCRAAGDSLGKHSDDRCNDGGGSGLVAALFREELASLF